MRTTFTLDDDVVSEVERLRREEGIGISEAVNRLIRLGMVTRPATGVTRSCKAVPLVQSNAAAIALGELAASVAYRSPVAPSCGFGSALRPLRHVPERVGYDGSVRSRRPSVKRPSGNAKVSCSFASHSWTTNRSAIFHSPSRYSNRST